MVTKILTHIQ